MHVLRVQKTVQNSQRNFLSFCTYWKGELVAAMQHWLGYNIHFFTQNVHTVKFFNFLLLKFATKKEQQHNMCGAFQAEQLYSRTCIQI